MENTNNGKGLSIAALVLGIIASCIAWWGLASGFIALVCGIVGIVLAVMGKKKAKEAGAPTGIATAGLVLSIIGTILSVIGLIACGICVAIAAAAGEALNDPEFADQLNDALSQLQ